MSHSKIAVQAAEFIFTRKIEELAGLTRAKIARALKIDANDLANKFKNHHHITLPRFILREKLHRAALLLEKKQDLTIDDLATKLGFSKPDHFNMEFNRYFAIEPAQYRNLKTR